MAFLPSAHALFEDAEARRAILELRQRFDASAQENAQMRRSLLDLQAQIETLRGDLAQLRGQNEQLAREASEIQRTQNDLAQGVDERLSRFEPGEVQVDGNEGIAGALDLADQFHDFPIVQQQLAGAGRIGDDMCGCGCQRRDVHADQEDFATLDDDVGFLDVHPAGTNGLDLPTLEGNSRLVFLLDEEIVKGFFVVGYAHCILLYCLQSI